VVAQLHERIEHRVRRRAGIQKLPCRDELEPGPVVGVVERCPRDEPRHPRVTQQHPAEVLVLRFEAQPFPAERVQLTARTEQLREPCPVVRNRPRRREHDEVCGAAEPDMHVGEHLAQ